MNPLFVAANSEEPCARRVKEWSARGHFRSPPLTAPSSRTSHPQSDPSPPKASLPAKLSLILLLATCFMSCGFGRSGRVRQTATEVQQQEHGDEIKQQMQMHKQYLYWGPRIDCPGKYCVHCGGLGHQESSLRCALEEAMFLNRTFVLPSKMCVAPEHSNTNLPMHIKEMDGSLLYRTDALYDLASMSHRVPVITTDSKEWQDALNRKQEVFAQVDGVKREELKRNSVFQEVKVINRTANRLSWFMECKNRHNRSAITLPYSFLPSMAARPLQDAADLIRTQLQDYDALHVRRGDKVQVSKAKPGAAAVRSMYTTLDRDTQPDAIIERIKLWIPPGRTLYIATDEKQEHYFDKLASKMHVFRYRVVKAANFSATLDPVVHNNYQLFMVERLVMLGAKTLVKTWKEGPGDRSLSDEAKKKKKRGRRWQSAAR